MCVYVAMLRNFILAAGCCAVAIPSLSQQPAKHSFEVMSVKPSNAGNDNSRINTTPQRVMFDNVTLRQIILMSFGIRSDSQIEGLPDWARSERFNIDAKVDEELAATLPKMKREERQAMQQEIMQDLLAQRFHMQTHRTKKELPVLALVVVKTGPKLKQSVPPPPPPDADPKAKPGDPGTSTSMRDGEMDVTNGTMELLANQISRMDEADGRVVVDKTGLKGNFDWELRWSPETRSAAVHGADNNAPPPPAQDTTKPTFSTALQEQLGLKLEHDKAPVDILIIDHLERPTEN